MFFQNLTRRNEIGANCYLLQLGDSRIILDAGLHPKYAGLGATPDFSQIEFDSVDAVVLSHAHLDHAGSLPLLARQQPRAEMFMTKPTADLADAMLHNSVNVMSAQRSELGITEYPLFTHREVESVVSAWRTLPTRKPFLIGNHGNAVECEFYDAGHVLGSVGAMFRCAGRTVFYTGDVHFEDQTLCREAHFPVEAIDTVIIETTRGAEQRSPDYTRAREAQRFATAIQRTLERGGAVLIPVFALGKTQEILTMIDGFKREERILDVPVFIGGLGAKMTTVYDRHAGNSHRHHADFRILEDMDLVLSSRRRGKRGKPVEIRYLPGSIYAISSGMMTQNTLSNRFSRNILPEPCNSLLFVGYADPDSPAGKIRAARHGDMITLDPGEPPLPLACEVDAFDFSGHATREAMRDFVRRIKPRQVILVHGDEAACGWFQRALQEDLPDAEIVIPPPGKAIAL